MGLSTRLTHILVLTGFNRPSGSLRLNLPCVPRFWSGCHLLRSFNGPEPGAPESMIRNKGERKRLIFTGLCRKPTKSLTRGLLCSWRPQEPSWWGEGAEHLLKRVLEPRAGKWTQRASALQGISLKKRGREREREKEKERHGDQSSAGAEVF